MKLLKMAKPFDTTCSFMKLFDKFKYPKKLPGFIVSKLFISPNGTSKTTHILDSA